jgi:hypothetical protein
VGWQGERTLQAIACKDEQRRQRARGRPDRVRSAVTKEVKVIGALKVTVHAVFLKVTSGQLRFLGSRAPSAPLDSANRPSLWPGRALARAKHSNVSWYREHLPAKSGRVLTAQVGMADLLTPPREERHINRRYSPGVMPTIRLNVAMK